MRCVSHNTETDKLYLYDFGGTKVNGFIIREEVIFDLVLRGLLMTSRVAITGDLFVDEHGAGIYGFSKWEKTNNLHRIATKELNKETTRLLENGPVCYDPCMK